MECAREVRGLRESMGMNRRQFCEYYGIPYRTVTDWETGKRTMPEYVLKLLKYKAEVEKLPAGASESGEKQNAGEKLVKEENKQVDGRNR